MEDEDGYLVLDPWGKWKCPPRQGAAAGSGFQGSQRVPAASPRCPRRLLEALTATLALSLVLCLSWWAAQRWQSKGTAGYGNASLGTAFSGWDDIVRELRRILCPPRERDGCRLCAVGWRLIGTKCYWISDGMNPWSKSREDCGNRGSTLLVPWDQDEMEFLNESLQKPTRHFWIGLSVPVAGTGWMWENSSNLDEERLQLDLRKRGPGACGTLKGNGIVSQSCDTRLQWICKRESAEI
ncbi:PREDICTED: killer cell lectin-like receptor subfamily B member 1B allele B [Sturnus vulgaris]|uniref:killer cell lectin-like receptor subfamily B member 1B allele B n=1 Tax=Sturnus vulgaris TaxID=9172 RepID=UPI00071A243D|nr:PREDICTED: killer cell lectin-like receptor subfamily B member 1B allele B [Sturnus vulgaris]